MYPETRFGTSKVVLDALRGFAVQSMMLIGFIRKK